MKLPEEYVRYFAVDRPKEGGLIVEPGWFELWPPEEIGNRNRDYQAHKSKRSGRMRARINLPFHCYGEHQAASDGE